MDPQPIIINAKDKNKQIEIIVKKFSINNNGQLENQLKQIDQQLKLHQLESKIEFEIIDKALDSYKGQVQETEILKQTKQRLNLEDIFEIMVETVQSNQFNQPDSNLQIFNNQDHSFISFQYNLTICNRKYPIKLNIPLEKVVVPIEQQLYRSNQKWFNEIEKLKNLRFDLCNEESLTNSFNLSINQVSTKVNEQIEISKLDIQELKQQNQQLRIRLDQLVDLKSDIDKIQNYMKQFDDDKSICQSLNENINDQNYKNSQDSNCDEFLKIQSENTSLQQQVDKLTVLNKEIQENQSNQINAIQQLKAQNQELLEKVNKLQNINSELNQNIKELMQLKDNLQDQITQLNNTNSQITQNSNKKIQQLKQENDKFQQQVNQLNSTNSQITQNTNRQIQQLNQEKTTLQQQINKLNQDIKQQSQPQSKVIQGMISFLESQISQLNNVNAEITYKSQMHIDGIYQDKERLKSEVSQLISLISYIAQYSTQEIQRLRSYK